MLLIIIKVMMIQQAIIIYKKEKPVQNSHPHLVQVYDIQKFFYFNPNEIKYVTVITTRVIIRSPGDTIYINDTLQYQQTGTRIKTTYNKYRNIDIPLVIGYELGNGKIHANINAGVIINAVSYYKGDAVSYTHLTLPTI